MTLIISDKVAKKLLDKHNVTVRDVEQCFENRIGGLLEDTRDDHKTDPPTQWFIANTNSGRTLKITFVREEEDIYLKSAYDANEDECRIYTKYAS